MLSRQLKLILFIIVFLISGALLFNAITRDIVYEKDYTGDLRNRVVGARLISDGKSPYFYKWSADDGTRYYDPNSYGNATVSNITATPFFHQLLIPISAFPQSVVSKIWFCAEYLMLFTIVLVALSFCNSTNQKMIVLLVSIAFLFTEAWKFHVFTGQMYLTIAFLFSLFIFFFNRARTGIDYFCCGILAASVILVRPNFIVFFIPFIFLLPQLKVKPVLILLLPGIIGMLFILTSSFQRQLWSDFFSAVKIHTQIHQGQSVDTVTYTSSLKYKEWEGINMKNASTITPDMKNFPRSENGNFFVLVKVFLHKKIGPSGLLITSSLLLLILSCVFYYLTKKTRPTMNDIIILACLGFCFYMVTDLFSPIYRHQYYTLQWVAPVLLFFSISKIKTDWKFMLIICSGIILNMLNIPVIKMEHTIGEYLVLCTLLLYSFVYFKRKKVES